MNRDSPNSVYHSLHTDLNRMIDLTGNLDRISNKIASGKFLVCDFSSSRSHLESIRAIQEGEIKLCEVEVTNQTKLYSQTSPNQMDKEKLPRNKTNQIINQKYKKKQFSNSSKQKKNPINWVAEVFN